MGHLAIAYVCYKVVTPLRYMVTVGKTLYLLFRKLFLLND